MVNLIKNENMKIYRRARTWIMVCLLVLAAGLGSFADWYYDSTDSVGWRTNLETQQANIKQTLSDTSIPQEMKEDLQNELKLVQYQLDHDIKPESETIWSGINGSASLVMLITLFTVIIAGDSLAGEFSTGTIKLLLIRPASRSKILLSKYLAMILFGLFLLVTLFVSSVIINGALYQFDGFSTPHLSISDSGDIVERSMVVMLWKTYLLNGVSTIMFVTMAFMISAAFRSSAMAIGFSIFALFAGTIATQVLAAYFSWAKYLLFANIDLTQHLNGRPFMEGMTMGFSVTVLLVYFAVFNLVSWLVFTKRDVAA